MKLTVKKAEKVATVLVYLDSIDQGVPWRETKVQCL
jgi:hypothetical protein